MSDNDGSTAVNWAASTEEEKRLRGELARVTAEKAQLLDRCIDLERWKTDALKFQDQLSRVTAERDIKSRYIDRLPFCADHRDKVAGKACRECEVERLGRQPNEALAERDEWQQKHATVVGAYNKCCEANEMLEGQLNEALEALRIAQQELSCLSAACQTQALGDANWICHNCWVRKPIDAVLAAHKGEER